MASDRKQAVQAVASAIALLEQCLASGAEHCDPEHVQRMVRCAVLLLTAHVDAHLSQQEQGSD